MKKIELTGRLAADVERKISKTGKEFLYFRVGNNEFNDKDEQGNQKTYWFNVTTFNQRHFGMAQYLTKGKSIIVDGDYSDRIYQTKDGNCEISRDIIANAIYFNSDGNSNNTKTNQTKTTIQASPSTQTTMSTKPTTADVKVPEAPVVSSNNDDDDDLPF